MIKIAKVITINAVILLFFITPANAQTNELGLKVHHMTISVKNIDTMVYWYTHILDLKLVSRSGSGDFKGARIDLGGFFIDMIQVKGSQRQPAQDLSEDNHMLAQGWRHLVFNVDDVYRTYTLLKAKGVSFPLIIDEKNKATVNGTFFKDPEGNVLEIRHIMQ